ncbi:MAG: glyoxylate/hydroxypyruvate reductase A [Proteobacteria bacterium]|nr:glyoxylate/hydroxypyruvate reductase A [Pseudomonadota bacterium]
MSLVIISPWKNVTQYRKLILDRMPDLDVRVSPDVGPADKVEFALVWNQPPGSLKRFPRLKFICSMGAGVDHMLKDPELPEGVPMVRLVDRLLASQMVEYVMLAVLRYHRQYHEYREQQRRGVWKVLPPPNTEATRVGVMGVGNLGGLACRRLSALGFDVAGWSRRPKTIEGIKSYYGDAGLRVFLERTQILSCLLPLTPRTAGIINKGTLSSLPKGAYVINSARGGHVIEEDLLAALDSGHIAAATLDVFQAEPLPAEHPFWSHPKVVLTPHASSITIPDSVVPQIVENIERARAGRPLLNLVDPVEGY